MNKKILLLSLGLIAAVAFAADFSVTQNMDINSNAIAATTTNAVAGAPFQLFDGQDIVRLYVTANADVNTTNGTLVVKFATASGNGVDQHVVTNEFDSAAKSLIKLTLTPTGAGTLTKSDWFVLRGARFIEVGQMENNSAGTFSNIIVRCGYNRSQR
jgi:hypothetical protein